MMLNKGLTNFDSNNLLNKETPSYGQFTWALPSISIPKLHLLFSGYLRNKTNQDIHEMIGATPNVSALCIDYLNTMNSISRAKIGESVFSPLFCVCSFKWFMILKPKGTNDSHTFQWYLCLAAPSPNVTKLKFHYKVQLLELNDNCNDSIQYGNEEFSTIKDTKNIITSWQHDIDTAKIDALEQLTITLELQIQSIHNMDTNIFSQYYSDPPLLSSIQQTQSLFYHELKVDDLLNTTFEQNKTISGPFFDINGSKWQIVAVFSRHHTMIVLRCAYIPRDISAIYIYYSLRIIETDTNKSNVVQMNDADYSDAWFEDKLYLSSSHQVFCGQNRLNELHLKLEITLIEVYDLNGNILTHKYSKQQSNPCALVPFSCYIWNIPFMNKSKCKILCDGYIRNECVYYIPFDIVCVCILYYDDSNVIKEIQNASNADQFDSDIFIICGFKFFMELYPNGLSADDIGDFNWYLTLASLSPQISKLYFGYKVHLMETDTKWDSVSSFCHESTSLGWPENTLSIQRIQTLHSITIKVSIALFDVLDKRKSSIKHSQYLSSLQNIGLHNAMEGLEWNIDDKHVLFGIKKAKRGSMFDSAIFNMFGLKWYLSFYPNFSIKEEEQNDDTMNGLYVRLCSIPPNISSVAVKYSLICKETNRIFQVNAEFNDIHLSEGCSNNIFLSLDELQKLNMITFRIEVTLIDVYNNIGVPITDEWIKLSNEMKNISTASPKGSYEWKIRDFNEICKIKVAENGDSFCSSIFSILGLKWCMEMCPMGDNKKSSGNVEWYFHLVSLPSNISSICVYYKIVLLETGTIDCHTTSFRLMHTSYGWGLNALNYSDLIDINIESLTFCLDITILDIYDLNGDKIANDYFVDKLDNIPIRIACCTQFEWKISDKRMINDKILNGKTGECIVSDRFSVSALNDWFLSFYSKGVKEEFEGCSELFVSIKKIPNHVKSISFYFELILIETNTKYSNFIHFKDDFLCKGWTPYKIRFHEIQHLNCFTFNINVKLIEVYDDKHAVITHRYQQ